MREIRVCLAPLLHQTDLQKTLLLPENVLQIRNCTNQRYTERYARRTLAQPSNQIPNRAHKARTSLRATKLKHIAVRRSKITAGFDLELLRTRAV